MTPRNRNAQNRSLPRYWRIKKTKSGITYYMYRVPPHLRDQHDGKKEISLGKSLMEAYKKFASLYERDECVTTLAAMLDRYRMEVVPEYDSANTRDSKLRSLDRLRASLGDSVFRISSIFSFNKVW